MLRDISLSIPRGQTLAIIGESGCGKTVLLKNIIGLLFPTSGHVVFDGQRIDELNDKELTALRSRFGFLFQNAALFDSMTVADNVAFPLKENSRMRQEKIDQIVAERLAASRAAARACSASGQPSFRAACGSASAWPGRW